MKKIVLSFICLCFAQVFYAQQYTFSFNTYESEDASVAKSLGINSFEKPINADIMVTIDFSDWTIQVKAKGKSKYSNFTIKQNICSWLYVKDIDYFSGLDEERVLLYLDKNKSKIWVFKDGNECKYYSNIKDNTQLPLYIYLKYNLSKGANIALYNIQTFDKIAEYWEKTRK